MDWSRADVQEAISEYKAGNIRSQRKLSRKIFEITGISVPKSTLGDHVRGKWSHRDVFEEMQLHTPTGQPATEQEGTSCSAATERMDWSRADVQEAIAEYKTGNVGSLMKLREMIFEITGILVPKTTVGNHVRSSKSSQRDEENELDVSTAHAAIEEEEESSCSPPSDRVDWSRADVQEAVAEYRAGNIGSLMKLREKIFEITGILVPKATVGNYVRISKSTQRNEEKELDVPTAQSVSGKALKESLPPPERVDWSRPDMQEAMAEYKAGNIGSLKILREKIFEITGIVIPKSTLGDHLRLRWRHKETPHIPAKQPGAGEELRSSSSPPPERMDWTRTDVQEAVAEFKAGKIASLMKLRENIFNMTGINVPRSTLRGRVWGKRSQTGADGELESCSPAPGRMVNWSRPDVQTALADYKAGRIMSMKQLKVKIYELTGIPVGRTTVADHVHGKAGGLYEKRTNFREEKIRQLYGLPREHSGTMQQGDSIRCFYCNSFIAFLRELENHVRELHNMGGSDHWKCKHCPFWSSECGEISSYFLEHKDQFQSSDYTALVKDMMGWIKNHRHKEVQSQPVQDLQGSSVAQSGYQHHQSAPVEQIPFSQTSPVQLVAPFQGLMHQQTAGQQPLSNHGEFQKLTNGVSENNHIVEQRPMAQLTNIVYEFPNVTVNGGLLGIMEQAREGSNQYSEENGGTFNGTSNCYLEVGPNQSQEQSMESGKGEASSSVDWSRPDVQQALADYRAGRIVSLRHLRDKMLDITGFRVGTNTLSDRIRGYWKFSCDVCERKFRCRQHVERHRMIHTGERPLECLKCGKRFRLKAHLKLHDQFHRRETRFKCHLCPKSFVMSGKLKEHIRVHTGEKPFKCGFCPLTFRQLSSRRDHQVALHTKAFQHRCDICSKGFINPYQVRKHKKKGKCSKNDNSE